MRKTTRFKTRSSPAKTTIRRIRPAYLPIPWFSKWLALVVLSRIFPLTVMKRHGYIVARSGVGKSELLKIIILRLKTRLIRMPWWSAIHNKRTVVLLDPHGELAEQTARQTLFNDDARKAQRRKRASNLLYLDPHQFPAINPLEIKQDQTSRHFIQRKAQFLTHAFASMIGHSRQDLSVHMKALLTPMLEVLLTYSAQHPQRPKTLFDLAIFLDDEQNQALLDFAQTKVENLGLKTFFKTMFQHPRYQASKFSLRSKLMSLLNQEAFTKLLAQPHSSWDLEKTLDAGQTLIINASKSQLGAEVSAIYGRTLLALIKSHVFLRKTKKHRPIFLLIDEAMTFLTEDMQTILEELRKFGLHLVLAMQRIPQEDGKRALMSSILANTGLKVIGAGGYQTLQKMALETSIPKEAFQKLKVGRFLIANQGRRPILLKVPRIWRDWRKTVSSRKFRTAFPKTKTTAISPIPTKPLPLRPWL